MSNSVRVSRRSGRSLCLACSLLGALSVVSPRLSAEVERPSLLLGGGETKPKPPAPIDPALPTGSRRVIAPRPQGLDRSVCSAREPVCVHADRQLPAELLADYAQALGEARGLLVGALGLPAPLADTLGPGPELDLYLLPRWTAGVPDELEVLGDAPLPGSDRSSGSCRARPRREELRRQSVECVAEALLLGLDAAESPFLRRAVAAYLWHTVGGSTNADLLAIDRFQANPQLSWLGRELTPESAGAALFFHFLDRRLGAGQRGVLPAALVQMSRRDAALAGSATATVSLDAGAPAAPWARAPWDQQWNNEPDVLDVLRAAFTDRKRTFDDFLLDFAVWRAFLGSRDAGQNAPELLWLGDAGRVRFEWSLKASSLPRRVAPLRPLEPLGTSYLWLEVDRVTLGKNLAFQAEWESPAAIRWTLVAIDGRGQPLQRYDLPYVQNATSAERTIENQRDASAFLIVGTSVGGVDLAHPIDPDHEPLEPHGFTVYLAEL
jgi:hypothetical protein